MTATAEFVGPASRKPLTLVVKNEYVDDRDLPARTYVALVALARDSVDPTRVIPAALILKAEGHVELPTITFGSNYELDVRSIELDRGLVDALDAGWLSLRGGKLTVTQHAAAPAAADDVRERAQRLFDL